MFKRIWAHMYAEFSAANGKHKAMATQHWMENGRHYYMMAIPGFETPQRVNPGDRINVNGDRVAFSIIELVKIGYQGAVWNVQNGVTVK